MKRVCVLLMLFVSCRAPSASSISSMPITPSSTLVAPAATQTHVLAPVSQGRTLPSPGEGSRSRLLEMHQELARERDKLAAALSASEADRAGLADALDRIGTERADALRELASMRERAAKLEAQNMELAQRLVTAQIRRLEAEKLLLVSRLSVPTGVNAKEAGAKDARLAPSHPGNGVETVPPRDAHATEPARDGSLERAKTPEKSGDGGREKDHAADDDGRSIVSRRDGGDVEQGERELARS